MIWINLADKAPVEGLDVLLCVTYEPPDIAPGFFAPGFFVASLYVQPNGERVFADEDSLWIAVDAAVPSNVKVNFWWAELVGPGGEKPKNPEDKEAGE